MIYTTYFSKLKEIPNNALKIFIAMDARDNIKDSLRKYNCLWCKEFAPSRELRNSYKNNEIPFYLFQAKYIIEQHNKQKDLVWNQYYEIIKKELSENKDVYFICYEKDKMECHRYPFSKMISELSNSEYKEATYTDENKDK